MVRKTKYFKAEAIPFWALISFLILTFIAGGGARADIQSLIILRPAAILFCGIGLWSLKWDHVKAHSFLFGMAGAIFALVLCHLVPLPPSIWGALPGRGILTEVDKMAQLGAVWRPISMVPTATWNAFYALFIPLAILLLGAQLNKTDLAKLLPLFLGFGLLSGLLGLLQTISDPQGPLYFYNVTNNGMAVGFFSNRNHHAIYLACMFPMLATFARVGLDKARQGPNGKWMVLGVAAFMAPLLLITGSRAGLLAGLLALVAAWLSYRASGESNRTAMKPHQRRQVLIGAAMIVVLLGLELLLASRSASFSRLLTTDAAEEYRFLVWGPIMSMANSYFPVGSGIGSFVEVFQIDEPSSLLDPTYLNHAHNDWLEVYLTAGLVGVMMLALALWAWLRAAIKLFHKSSGQSSSVRLARLGIVTLFLLGLTSFADYPLRVPLLSAFFVIGALWVSHGCNLGVSELERQEK